MHYPRLDQQPHSRNSTTCSIAKYPLSSHSLKLLLDVQRTDLLISLVQNMRGEVEEEVMAEAVAEDVEEAVVAAEDVVEVVVMVDMAAGTHPTMQIIPTIGNPV